MPTQPQLAPGSSGLQQRTFTNTQVQALSDYIDAMCIGMVGETKNYIGVSGVANGYIDSPTGRWLYVSLDTFRTIGNTASNSHWAGAWTQVFYEFIWNNFANTLCPTLTSAGGARTRGVSATADYNDNTRINIPDFRGRVIVVAGDNADSAITAKVKNEVAGNETVSITADQMPAHTHNASNAGNLLFPVIITNNSGGFTPQNQSSGNTWATQTGTDVTGGGQPVDIMQPYTAQHLLVHSGYRLPT